LARQLPILLIAKFFSMRIYTVRASSERWVMKSKFVRGTFIVGLAVLALALSGGLSIGVLAQTTQETPAPSDQPSAPMEIGQIQPGQAQPGQAQPGPSQPGQGPMEQDQAGPQAPPSDTPSADAQPTEAQPGGPSGEAAAKTDQGVARVSLIHGDVSTQRGDSGDWSAAALNQPVMAGDKVSTGDNARTELQLDFANTLRLGANSKANIANFTHKNIQIQLGQGLATYTVSRESEAEPEIDTPNVSVHPAHKDGVFRIEVRPDGDTLVIVREGEAQISTPQGSAEVRSGEMATVRGDSNSAQYKISPAPQRDDWDRWNSDRDHMIRNASSWQHTNHYYTGTQDLDAYGRWQNVPDYGNVWVPNEPDGWVPYRDGNWTYEPYYGWTWVGYEPWGWAPYHYGRWFPYGGAWAWWPGPIYAGGFYRPFWAPAYVSFWGWGAGFGFGFGWGGWGGFGWLPIGPGDWFHPWWGGYGGRFGVVGFRGGFDRFGGFAPLHAGTRFSNIANIHDAHVGGALSTVNAGHFGAGRVMAAAATREQLGGARMMAGNLPVVPSRASLSASGRAAAPSTVRNGSEHFFGTAHTSGSRQSFQQETASLRQSMAQNHVGAVPAGGREGGAESASARATSAQGAQGTNGSMGKPSAGTSRAFTPPSSSGRSSASASAPASSAASPSNAEGRSSAQSASTANRDGFRPFTPPSHSDAGRGESSASSGGQSDRGSSGSYWNRTESSSTGARASGSYSDGYGRGSSSRPQLDMRQPIARSPSNGGYRAPSYNGSHSAPSGGHVSAPSGGGGHASSGGHSGGGGHR
jgi:hypothetical protein